MLSYRAILKQAWRISWKNKFLWFFGFFASLISFTTEFKVISRTLGQDTGIRALNNIKIFLSTGIFSKNAWMNIVELTKTDPKSIVLLISIFLLLLIVIAFFAWLSTASQIGIIDSVNKIIKQKKEKLSIKNSLKIGSKKFWPVFIMNTAISLVINITYLLIGFLLILVIVKNQALATIIYGIIFIIFIPISLFISFIIKYAIAFMIIENKKFFKSIKQGWILFTENWLISVEMAIVLFLINIIAFTLLSIISFVGFYLFFSLALSAIFVLSSGFLFWAILTIGMLTILAAIILTSSILNVFQITSWTDLFIKLRNTGGDSKLERLFQ